MAQRRQRIHPRRPARRQIAGEDRGTAEDQGDGAERQGVEADDAGHLAGDDAAEGVGRGEAEPEAGGGQGRALAQDQAEDGAAAGASQGLISSYRVEES